MTMPSVRRALVLTFSGAALAQVAGGQTGQLPPIHPLSAVEHASKDLLGAVSQVRALPGGRLLVNDNAGRKLVLLDASLASMSIVADTTSATANAYSSRAAGLITYRGDSTLFVDPSSLSMLVIDGGGKVTRVMSVPRPNDAGALIGGGNGTPGFDARGRLVYRANAAFRMAPPSADGKFTAPTFPDSSVIVRIDLATRVLDTVGFVKIPKQNISMSQDANGRMTVSMTINPMPITDDWAVLADGSVAILRGQDYHIDWTRGGGEKQSTGKVPFAWRHLDDSTKIAFLDSTKTAMEKLRETAMAQQRAANGGAGPIVAPPADGGGGGAPLVMAFRVGGGDGGGATRGAAPGGGALGAGGRGDNAFQMPPIQMVPPSDLPDYAPPFTAGSARGDMDGNLWVRTSNVVNGGSVYDVINGKGELIDRVLVPMGRVISGFGPGGMVYMGVRETGGVRLEQARRK